MTNRPLSRRALTGSLVAAALAPSLLAQAQPRLLKRPIPMCGRDVAGDRPRHGRRVQCRGKLARSVLAR